MSTSSHWANQDILSNLSLKGKGLVLLAVLTLGVIPLAPALAGKWKIEDEIQLAR